MKLLALRAPLLAAGVLPLAWPSSAPAPDATTWAVDPVHASCVFKARHFGMTNFYGTFDDVRGEVRLDEGDLAKSSVSIRIAAGSVDSNNEARDTHLEGPDFFNAAEFPLVTFTSKRVERVAADRFRVAGELTARGVAKELSLEVVRTGQGTSPMRAGERRMAFETEFDLRMADFGMPAVERMPETTLGHVVHVIVSVECVAR
jgi:polyisoprenoid-binding protein YceI